MKNKELIQKLSSDQKEAIIEEGNILLIAIPGSGKTRTLTNKVIYEYDGNNIRKTIAITYTNRAAEEMKERIINQIGQIPDNIWIGTIHKFCLDFVIRKYSRFSENLSKPFTIIGEDDQRKLKRKILDKHHIFSDYYIDYTLSVSGEINEQVHKKYVEDYYDELLKNNQIDFNYILYESYKILNENEIISKQISNYISMICIDEYQDTQELQYQILKKIYIQRKDIKLFIVGDPNQAIYNSLGGVVKNKKELEILFGTVFHQKKLDCCYRSNQEIIDFYRKFCVEDFDMKSGTDQYNAPEIEIISNINKSEITNTIKNTIIKLKKEGVKDNEICVLAPQWTFLYDISSKLKKELPDIKFDAPNILPLKKDEESVIYKICKILLSNYSFSNKNRILFIAREIKKQFLEEFSIELINDEYNLIKLILNSKSKKEKATEYLKESLILFFEKINLLEMFKEKIDDFVNQTEKRIEMYKEYGLEDDRLSLEKSLKSKEGIVISSFHSIKGEEYQAVIAFGLLEGYIPHWSSKNKGTEREDSKRLLFVICSRAKEKLYLIAENGRTNKYKKEYPINKEIKDIIDEIKK